MIKANYGVGHLNGSLWTIPVELQFYMILPLLAPLLWRGISKATANARLMVATATLFAVSWLFKTYSGDLSVFSENLAILARVTVLPYLYMFVLGILLQRNKKEWSPFLEGKGVYWLLIYVLAASALKYVLAIPEGTNTPNLFSMTLLAVTVVSLAFTRRGLSEQTLRGNDISYGTYVYHMVVANLAFQLGYSRTVPVLAAVLVASFGLAILSWFLVEKPALGLKRSALLVRGARATNRA